jgi:uncharacterized membrane protein YdbT with pleckstrin-like domain
MMRSNSIGCWRRPMNGNNDKASKAERSVAWQNRYLTPILLVVALVVIAASWAFAAIPWWLGALLVAFGGLTLINQFRNHRT